MNIYPPVCLSEFQLRIFVTYQRTETPMTNVDDLFLFFVLFCLATGIR